MDQDDNYIHCILCDYKAPRDRTDNFERHMQSKHYKNSVECECGAKMRRTSIRRHKNNSCPLRSSLQSSSKSIDINQNDSKSSAPENSLKENESTLNEPVELVSIEENKIETTIRVKTYSNGKVIFTHDEIKLGKYSFVLKEIRNDDSKGADTDASTSCLHTGEMNYTMSMCVI